MKQLLKTLATAIIGMIIMAMTLGLQSCSSSTGKLHRPQKTVRIQQLSRNPYAVAGQGYIVSKVIEIGTVDTLLSTGDTVRLEDDNLYVIR